MSPPARFKFEKPCAKIRSEQLHELTDQARVIEVQVVDNTTPADHTTLGQPPPTRIQQSSGKPCEVPPGHSANECG